MIDEMVPHGARMHRSRAIESHMLDTVVPESSETAQPLGRITAAFESFATSGALPLMHRYQTRLHMIYRRAPHNLLLLSAAVPDKPSPISGHSPDQIIPALPQPSGPKTT